MKEKEKVVSGWATFLNIFTLFATIFLILKAISDRNEKEEGEITPKAVKDEVKKVEKIEKKIYPINERQYKILAKIREKREMEPSEIYALEPDMSTRTLRRDMDVLVKQGVVKQEGSTKSTKYTYIG